MILYASEGRISRNKYSKSPFYFNLVGRDRHSESLRAGRSGDRIPVAARFSAPVQTGPGAHLASYITGTGYFLGIKWPGRGVDHPPPSSVEVKERVAIHILPSGPSWPVIGQILHLPLLQNVHSDFALKWKIISCSMEKKLLFILSFIYQDTVTIYGKNSGILNVE